MMKFTREHDWLRVEGDTATVGITQFAASQLGDLVYVELPKVGTKLKSGTAAVVVESVKTAYDILSPVGGEVVEVNQAAADDPASVTADPLGSGWLYRIRLADAAALDGFMDEADYNKLNT